MYAIYGQYTPNVSIYTIHGSVMGNGIGVSPIKKDATITGQWGLVRSLTVGITPRDLTRGI